MPQQRRLLETSNMFAVYRNSLKANDPFNGEAAQTMPATTKANSHHKDNHANFAMY
jgi:hypothetical protein